MNDIKAIIAIRIRNLAICCTKGSPKGETPYPAHSINTDPHYQPLLFQ
jgi:hypothetical protein